MGFEEANPASTETAKIGAGELRTWSRGKATLEASFVRLDGENVILRKTDGSEVAVPLEELSPADQSVVTMAGRATESVAP
jgi:hypothetical protein